MMRRTRSRRWREATSRCQVVVGHHQPSEGDLREWLPDDAGFSLALGSAGDESGASLDILVLSDGGALHGAIPVRLIGVLHADHTRLGRTVRHDRPVAVDREAKAFVGIDEIAGLDEAVLATLTQTWTAYNAAHCATFQVVSMTGAADALRLVRESTGLTAGPLPRVGDPPDPPANMGQTEWEPA